jgi:hypothetical protein
MTIRHVLQVLVRVVISSHQLVSPTLKIPPVAAMSSLES